MCVWCCMCIISFLTSFHSHIIFHSLIVSPSHRFTLICSFFILSSSYTYSCLHLICSAFVKHLSPHSPYSLSLSGPSPLMQTHVGKHELIFGSSILLDCFQLACLILGWYSPQSWCRRGRRRIPWSLVGVVTAGWRNSRSAAAGRSVPPSSVD